jgi:hypothetical protein
MLAGMSKHTPSWRRGRRRDLARERAGVEIHWEDPNRLQYNPAVAVGRPGTMRLDPDVSIGGLRHEYQHFLDDRAAGFPGIGYYAQNWRVMARMEAKAYYQEILAARATGHPELVPLIVQQMRTRVAEIEARLGV